MACGVYYLSLILLLAEVKWVSTETCTYTIQANHRAPDADKDIQDQVFGLEPCKAACTASTTCVYLSIIGTYCFHSQQTNPQSEIGREVYFKTCVPDTTQAATSPSTPAVTSPSTPAATSPSTPGSCRQPNTKGGINSFAKVKVDDMSCRDLCRFLNDCKSVSYDGTQCKIYTADTTRSVQVGSKHAIKTACFSGHGCCLNVVNNSTGGSSPAFIYTSSMESCETLCKQSSSCTGVSWKNSECTLYTYNTTTSSETGSTYIDKTCLNGLAPSGNITFTKLCMNSSTKTSSGIMVVVLLLASIVHI